MLELLADGYAGTGVLISLTFNTVNNIKPSSVSRIFGDTSVTTVQLLPTVLAMAGETKSGHPLVGAASSIASLPVWFVTLSPRT
jgi:hypothetical protein